MEDYLPYSLNLNLILFVHIVITSGLVATVEAKDIAKVPSSIASALLNGIIIFTPVLQIQPESTSDYNIYFIL